MVMIISWQQSKAYQGQSSMVENSGLDGVGGYFLLKGSCRDYETADTLMKREGM